MAELCHVFVRHNHNVPALQGLRHHQAGMGWVRICWARIEADIKLGFDISEISKMKNP